MSLEELEQLVHALVVEVQMLRERLDDLEKQIAAYAATQKERT